MRMSVGCSAATAGERFAWRIVAIFLMGELCGKGGETTNDVRRRYGEIRVRAVPTGLFLKLVYWAVSTKTATG